jgi:extracellular elastinolytic metalloproteinase
MISIRTCAVVSALATLFVTPIAAQNRGRFEHRPSRAHEGDRSRPLTGPSNAAPAAIVAQYLRGRGVDLATTASLVSGSSSTNTATGVTTVRLEQRLAGLLLYDTYAKAAISSRGELVSLIENIAAVPGFAPSTPRVSEAQALTAALQRLYPGVNIPVAAARRNGNTVVFNRHPFFHEEPTVTRVAFPTDDGSIAVGLLVETWSEGRNLLHETLVGSDGSVLNVEERTNSDSYKVFLIDPDKGLQQVVKGPGAGNLQSPAGWLGAAAQNSTNIAGNNAHAYLDRNADNAADGGGTAVKKDNFTATADLTASPSTVTNRAVAVQNLFYLNNVLHDELYKHGFTEAAGNFQQNNFGKGGRGQDPVNAEAQDGSGLDNANFATPNDGRSPRMQMFLWTGKGTYHVQVNAPAGVAGTYLAQGAEFGGTLNATGLTGPVTLVNDGVGVGSDGCEPTQPLGGQIALIDRGTCAFVVKVKNAQNAGAIAAIVVNNQGDAIFTMGGADATITIPSVFIGQSDGTTIKSASGVNATVKLADPAPLQRDGDVDSDIVYHEYGHGLTWRMIGRMSGPMSGAIGEGMSDVLSIIINEDDVVAEYSVNDPRGIRSRPYTNYDLNYRNYGDVMGSEVHFDGEVYAAIGWRLFQRFQQAGLSKQLLLDYLVDGMNFTPAGPKFEDMRDGILQAVANRNPGHSCLIWEAFAHYGVGVGAKAQVTGQTVSVVPSFAQPASCPAP